MIRLDLDNRFIRIHGIAGNRKALAKLDEVTSYKVAGAHFTPAFRAKRWDGREHLLAFTNGKGYNVPTGMLEDVIECLEEHGFEYEIDASRRKEPGKKIAVEWNDAITLRPYQVDAVEAILDEARGELMGAGILQMPIRSGKTKTAAAIIARLTRRTLFIVPSQMLLHQTRASLAESFDVELEEIGQIGDSEWIEKPITVASVQTLTRACGGKRGKKTHPQDPRYTALKTRVDIVFFDECHHLRAQQWRTVVLDFDSRYKIGLSATVYFDASRQQERGVIWLRACTGRVVFEVSPSSLIEAGYLMRPDIRLFKITEPRGISEDDWGQELTDAAIHFNEHRNAKIVSIAEELIAGGLRTLIVTNRKEQAGKLQELLTERDIPAGVITGEDKSGARRGLVKAFVDRKLQALIGTVFGEGVDIPEIDAVINAEGGRDVKATVQRMRCLTPHDGKTEAVFVDFMDLTNGYFAKHSRERLKAYKAEPAFKVRVVE
jgi:superfamily II DNA or RNA helicase